VDLGRLVGSQQANSLGNFWAQIRGQGWGGKGRESSFVPFLPHPHPLSQEKTQEERAQLFNALLEACHIKLILLAQLNLAKLQSHQNIITYIKQDIRLQIY